MAWGAGGGFGAPAAFGQPAAPAAGGFGQPAAAAGGFGQPAAAGAFGQPAAAPAAGGFGQPAAGGFGQPAAAGPFGAPAAPAGGAFGQPAAGAFGAPAAAGGAFGAPAAGAAAAAGTFTLPEGMFTSVPWKDASKTVNMHTITGQDKYRACQNISVDMIHWEEYRRANNIQQGGAPGTLLQQTAQRFHCPADGLTPGGAAGGAAFGGAAGFGGAAAAAGPVGLPTGTFTSVRFRDLDKEVNMHTILGTAQYQNSQNISIDMIHWEEYRRANNIQQGGAPGTLLQQIDQRFPLRADGTTGRAAPAAGAFGQPAAAAGAFGQPAAAAGAFGQPAAAAGAFGQPAAAAGGAFGQPAAA
eukprot:Rhum_TRINITY_DN14688_c4_g2::Rhum_TRINITY_DN14688_c4_g2_i4::g.108906::m.108906